MASRTFNELYCQAFVMDDESLTKEEKLGKLISLYARLEKEQEMKRQQEISNLECIDEKINEVINELQRLKVGLNFYSERFWDTDMENYSEMFIEMHKVVQKMQPINEKLLWLRTQRKDQEAIINRMPKLPSMLDNILTSYRNS